MSLICLRSISAESKGKRYSVTHPDWNTMCDVIVLAVHFFLWASGASSLRPIAYFKMSTPPPKKGGKSPLNLPAEEIDHMSVSTGPRTFTMFLLLNSTWSKIHSLCCRV